MATSIVNVFDEIHNNSMTAVGAKYTRQDVLNVWYHLAKQIIEALQEGKGLTVKGLGTFSLSNWSLETGNNNRTLATWRPVFTISKSLTEEFDLHQPKQYINDAVPLAPIGYHKLTKDCQLDKESVIGCIEEATQVIMDKLRDLDIVRDLVKIVSAIQEKISALENRVLTMKE